MYAPIISSSKRANNRQQFAPFGDDLCDFGLPQVLFPSVTPHAVKHNSPPSGTGVDIHFYPNDLRMNPIDGLLHSKRPFIAS